MSYIGTNSIGNMYLGTTGIAKAYLGSSLVWEKGGGQSYSRLPDGFTELAYVGTDSNAWLDTGVAGTTDLEITSRFSVGSYVQYGAVYGNYISENHKTCRCILSSTTALLVAGGASLNTTVSGFGLNRVHTLTVTVSSASLESKTTTISSSSLTANTNNICLGNRSVTNPAIRNIGLRIFAFGIKRAETQIMNLVPARREADSAIGFYDLIGMTFLKSETGTSFVAGPDAEYSRGMLLALHWNGTDNLASSKWYDRIGNQYYTLTNSTHGEGYYEFLNGTPSKASAYGLMTALPDLGRHWMMVVQVAVKPQASNPTIFVPLDFSSSTDTGAGTCAVNISLNNSTRKWELYPKFNGNSSAPTYAPDADMIAEDTGLDSVGEWMIRTISFGVRSSSTDGMDETFINIPYLNTSASSSPFTPLRFNRWATKGMYIARSALTPSSTYKYATNTRIYDIKIYYEP